MAGYGDTDKDSSALDYYLKEISSIDLLTQEEEMELARRIRQGDQEALNRLVEANLRFVVNVAKQYRNQGIPLADLINEGNMGLIKAAKRFDETKGFKFISYAVWWIKQSILQVLAEQSRIVRLPLNRAGALYKIGKASDMLSQKYGREATSEEIAKKLELKKDEVRDTLKISSNYISLDAPYSQGQTNTMGDFIEDDVGLKPDDAVMAQNLAKDILKVLETLDSREAEVINLYFGLGNKEPLTLEEIGEKLQITRERVRQIKEKALRRLQHKSRKKLLAPYLSTM